MFLIDQFSFDIFERFALGFREFDKDYNESDYANNTVKPERPMSSKARFEIGERQSQSCAADP